MKCHKCNIELEEKPIALTYLGHDFNVKLPCCPNCGQVFISEELAAGRVAQLEADFEEK